MAREKERENVSKNQNAASGTKGGETTIDPKTIAAVLAILQKNGVNLTPQTAPKAEPKKAAKKPEWETIRKMVIKGDNPKSRTGVSLSKLGKDSYVVISREVKGADDKDFRVVKGVGIPLDEKDALISILQKF